MVQKKLLGELLEWDPRARTLRVKFNKWWESGPDQGATVTFVLDPYAIVAAPHLGLLQLSELTIGQRVAVSYVTDAGGQPVAKTLTVSEARQAIPTLGGAFTRSAGCSYDGRSPGGGRWDDRCGW